MFGFLQTTPVNDATLGLLRRRGGWWVGSVELPRFGAVELRIAGPRGGPDRCSLDLAVGLPQALVEREGDIAHALYEHYLPGLEVLRSGAFPDLFHSFPEISAVAAVWPHVRGERVEVHAGQRECTIEIACSAAWDEEHTLGLRFNGERVVELCGSI